MLFTNKTLPSDRLHTPWLLLKNSQFYPSVNSVHKIKPKELFTLWTLHITPVAS